MAEPNKRPVIVTEGFTPDQMKKLMDLMKTGDGVPKDTDFGVVTSNNRRWRLSQLLDELRREHSQVGRPPR